MGLRKILLGAASALVLTAGVANAGVDRHGWYVGLEAGWVHVQDTDLVGSGMTSINFSSGWGALGTVGYALTDSNWRIEGELGYRSNSVDTTAPLHLFNGELTEWSGFVNAVYDIRLHSDRWDLGVGAGIGIDDARLQFTGSKDNNKSFAAQGIVGVTYKMTPHTDLMLNYRLMWADGAELLVGPAPVPSDLGILKHTVTIGLRYGFDNPPPAPVEAPPPPPPPPPPKAKQFIIFFGFNKCNITAEADAVLSEAASAAKSSGGASVRIVGHTDTVGSVAYNQKLSECRANAAKTNLVGKGVAEGAISTSGKGKSELMVQTGDGVKEPQNRRATVDLN